MGQCFRKARVMAMAACVPKEQQELAALGALYGEASVKKIMKVTGIERVAIAPEERTAADYCAAAAEEIFRHLSMEPQTVDGLVFVSETPDYIVPHTSALLQHRLGLPHHTLAFDLNYGCAGYVYGLFQAFLLVESGYCQRVLLCAGDTLSRFVNPEDKAVRMVLGDGGSATILEAGREDGAGVFSFYTDGSRASYLMIPAGGSRNPRRSGETDVLVADVDGNARTQENFYMNGLEVMGFALHETLSVIHDVAEKAGWALPEVELFALHQANALIVQYIAKQLKLKPERVPIAVKNTGNASSASIPSMMAQVFGGQTLRQEKVIACGFGTGLSCAAAALDMQEVHILPFQMI